MKVTGNISLRVRVEADRIQRETGRSYEEALAAALGRDRRRRSR